MCPPMCPASAEALASSLVSGDGPSPGPSHSSLDAGLVAIDPRARAAWSWLPEMAPPFSIWQAPGGDTLHVHQDGTVDPVGGVMPRRSVAADPCTDPRSR